MQNMSSSAIEMQPKPIQSEFDMQNVSSNVMEFQPKSIGREFVRRYYTILNKSPENLHCFYDDGATFVHDDIDPLHQKTISVVGKQAIRNVMKSRQEYYRHNCTIVNGIDTVTTINNGLVVKVFGEIAHNGNEMRPFSQSFVLMAVSSRQYYVLNEIFRFGDFLPNMKQSISEAESIADASKSSTDLNATFMDEDANEMMMTDDDHANDNDVTPESNAETINDIQTKHLKSLLQESRPSNYRKEIVSAVTVAGVAPMKLISNETAKQLFRDNCIITIGSVVNPSIKFDEDKLPELDLQMPAAESPPPQIVSKTEIATCDAPKATITSNLPPTMSTESENKTVIDVQPNEPTPVSPPSAIETKESELCENEKSSEAAAVSENDGDVVQAVPAIVEKMNESPIASEVNGTRKQSYAELLKLARGKSRSGSSSSRSSSAEHRSGSFSSIKDKPLIIRNSLRRKNDKQTPPNRRKCT